MNAELVRTVEYIEEDFEASVSSELVPEACAQQLGFVAVCASCPLLRMFGECPKEIRERAVENEEVNENVPLDGEPVRVFEDTFEQDAEEKMEENQEIRPASVTNKIETQSNRKPEKKPLFNSNGNTLVQALPKQEKKTAKKPEVQHRSFKELLFDDTVPVVVALPPNYLTPEMQNVGEEIEPVIVEVDETNDAPVEQNDISLSDVHTFELSSEDTLDVYESHTEQPVLQEEVAPLSVPKSKPEAVSEYPTETEARAAVMEVFNEEQEPPEEELGQNPSMAVYDTPNDSSPEVPRTPAVQTPRQSPTPSFEPSATKPVELAPTPEFFRNVFAFIFGIITLTISRFTIDKTT